MLQSSEPARTASPWRRTSLHTNYRNVSSVPPCPTGVIICLPGRCGSLTALPPAFTILVPPSPSLITAGSDPFLTRTSAFLAFHEPSHEPRPIAQRLLMPRSSLGLG